jgi:hypothetical protein
VRRAADACARPQPWDARPARGGPNAPAAADHKCSPGSQHECWTVPSSSANYFPLPAAVSRSLPAAASQAIGCAEPGHGVHSPGIGA